MKNWNFKYLIIFIMFFCSCEKDKKNDLEIKILNENINCVENLNNYELYNKSLKFDKRYIEKSINIVKYQIKNNSEKKYLIILDQSSFENLHINDTLFRNKYILNNSLNLVLSDGLKNANCHLSRLHFDGKNSKNHNFNIYYNLKDSIKCEIGNYLNGQKSFYENIKTFDIVNNYKVIYPGETKYFSTLVNLPISNYRYSTLPFAFKLDKKTNYKASIFLSNNKNITYKNLPSDIRKEVKENNYIIFDGTIKSNKVPVKMVRMPD
jgi:hypothetical protein